MRRNGDRGLVGGDREILDRGYGFHRTGDRWLPDRWLGMPKRVTDFDPTTVAGLKGWWKADSLTVVADGTAVDNWTDASGSGNNAIGGAVAPGETGKHSPAYFKNQVNGLPAMRFDSSQGRLCVLTTPFVTASGWTIFSVIKTDGGVADTCPLASVTTDANAGPLNNSESFYIGAGQWCRS